MTGSATLARANIKDYEFQTVDKTIEKGDAIIWVRPIRKLYGKPVSDAVLARSDLSCAASTRGTGSRGPSPFQ
jgi:hypothetical protein